MTSPKDAPPVKPPPSFSPGIPRTTSNARYSEKRASRTSLESDFVSSAASSAAILPAAASELSFRSASPHVRSASSSTPQPIRSALVSPLDNRLDESEDVRSLIIRAFSPAVGVYASPDTDELAREKGFKRGFWELVRPFGENVPGKIVIRDSSGSSRGWEDYGIRFIDLAGCSWNNSTSTNLGSPEQMDEVLEHQLDSAFADEPLGGSLRKTAVRHPVASPLYKLFLRQLLSAASMAPHETFGHPVAGIIVISSRNTKPLESLRQLYADTSNGNQRLPPWVNPEYLRYYVLVHDEDHDDITESTKLFDQMKRHFGLHCHLLRLRSTQCVTTDDDSVQTPVCEWLSPLEHLMRDREQGLIDVDTDSPPYLFDSDVVAIRSFIRELVAQSVIPFMESRVTAWNDQVASRRRGISGRFMSISRRWAGLGSGARSSSSTGGTSGNYDIYLGLYRPDSPEAILRKMADFAFMLRDWKLSASTYDLLRTDYGNDKAWRYHAGAHEMNAVSMLLNPLAMPAKTKLEAIDQVIHTACYSYMTRCSDATNALRCLCLASELLKSRGGSAAESAARWAMRIMEQGLLGRIGQALLSERISACYATCTMSTGAKWGSRHRKAGMWSVLAADLWLKMGRPALASICLEEAERLYADVLDDSGVLPIPEMQRFVDDLQRAVRAGYLETRGSSSQSHQPLVMPSSELEEISEKLDKHNHRRPIMDPGILITSQGPVNHEGKPNDDFERA